MCDAEDDLRIAEASVGYMNWQLEQIVELIEDIDRGLYTPGEARREAKRIRELNRRELEAVTR